MVSDRLWRLELQDAFAVFVLPHHIDWPGDRRIVDLSDRVQRARACEAILRHRDEGDLWRFIDRALLVDLRDELPLPAVIRTAWETLMINARLWA